MTYTPPPFPKGLQPDSDVPSARTLQAALKVKGYLSASVAPADNYGPATQAAVAKFYVAHGNDADIAIGPIGWAKLFTEAYGSPAPSAPGDPGQDMRRVSYGGHTVNVRTRTLLQRAGTWTLLQGSYNPGGVAASAGTHDGGGVVDVSVDGMSLTVRRDAVRRLRLAGFAAWLRTPAQGFDYHIHAVAIGDQELAPLARDQVQMYFDGYNGLANWGADDGPRGLWPAWAVKYRN